MKFHAVIEQHGKTATGIEVPAEIVDGLGQGKRPRVRVTLNGHVYRSTVGVMGGRYLIPVSADVRKQASVAAGDALDVHIEPDTEPREVAVPDDLAAALDRDGAARKAFDALSYSRRQRYVLSIEDAKTEATRRRRIDKAVAELRDSADS